MGSETADVDLAMSTVKTTILVVDDEVLVRAITSEELREQGYTVIEAANAGEALAVLSSPLRVDIVLTDMRMPNVDDGALLTREIRTKWPYLKIVMISTETPDAEVRALLDGYLSKPFLPVQLVTYVQRIIDTQARSGST